MSSSSNVSEVSTNSSNGVTVKVEAWKRLESLLQKKRVEMNSLKTEVRVKESQFRKLNEEFYTLMRDSNQKEMELKKTIDALEERENQLDEKESLFQTVVGELEKKKRELEGRDQHFQATIDEFRRSKFNWEETESAYLNTIEVLKANHAQREAELNSTIEEWKLKCEEKEQEVERKEQEMQEREEEWMGVKQEVGKVHEFHDEIETQLHEANQRNTELRDEILQARMKLSRFQTSLVFFVSIVAACYLKFLLFFEFFVEKLF